MDFCTGKAEFLKLFDRLDDQVKGRFARWAGGYCANQIETLAPTQNEELLDMISDELRKHVEAPGGRIDEEITMAPEENRESVETDEFIYPDQVLEAMDYSLQQCRACQSRDIEDLDLVSHSMTKDEMMALFYTMNALGPFEIVLDIGSRSGCVLMAGALLSPKTERLIGVEIDEKWSNLSRKVAKKFELDDKVEVHNINAGDKEGLALVEKADLVIMHNPFEWFSTDGGAKTFGMMTKHFKPNSRIVTMPAIESQKLPVDAWGVNITPKKGPWVDELKEFALYRVNGEN